MKYSDIKSSARSAIPSADENCSDVGTIDGKSVGYANCQSKSMNCAAATSQRRSEDNESGIVATHVSAIILLPKQRTVSLSAKAN